MHSSKLLLLSTLFALVMVVGCSGRGNPVTPENQVGELDSIPIISLADAGYASNALGIMGAYQLAINPEKMSAELISMRTPTIGESYIVSGIAFFTIAPCKDCLKIVGFDFGAGNIALKFIIRHPFDPGELSLPPSARNRRDLDVFDLAMVIKPDAVTPTNYPLMGTSIYSGVVANASGYTRELSSVITDNAALPFVLVVDDSLGTTSTWNKFAMGANQEFEVAFKLTPGTPLKFDMYLTMGYGASAKKPDRLAPKYYNPEFNRKAAWKVEAEALGSWIDNDSTIPIDVEVKVYDWQIGATIYATPSDFASAPADNVYAASEVASVSVEIPGMNSTLPSVTTPDSGAGTPNDPLIFTVPVANQNLIATGDYVGLVKVLDERPVLTVSDGRDIIIDTPDGMALNYYAMPEYATYQTFEATVIEGCTGFCWAKTWGGTSADSGYSVTMDSSNNTYVTGTFSGTVEFNPAGGGSQTSHGTFDVFLSKFDSNGNWQWTKIWGGTSFDIGRSLATDSSNNIYVTGTFSGTVEFNPAGGGSQTSHSSDDVFLSKFDSTGIWQWTKTWSRSTPEEGLSVTTDNLNSIYVAGCFMLTVEFNPDGGGSQTSHGYQDVFLSKFDTTGNWQWTKIWGGTSYDEGYSVTTDSSNNTYVTGFFNGTVEFNPSGGGSQTSHGYSDVFLSKFDSNGNWQWTKIWGGTGGEVGYSVTTDSWNNIYVTGFFIGTVEFNPSGGGSQTSHGNTDVFLSKFDASGNWQWTKIWGGTGQDGGYSTTTDSWNSAYVTGWFSDNVEFNPAGGGSQTSHGDYDVFLSKFDASGNWQWTKIWGGTGQDEGYSTTTDSWNSAYVTGHFSDNVEFNPDGGEPQTCHGAQDVFLSKMKY